MLKTVKKPTVGVALCLILTLLFGMVFSFPVSAESDPADDLQSAGQEADEELIIGERDADLAESGASTMFLNKTKMTLDIGQQYKIIAFDAATRTSIVKTKFTTSDSSVVTVTTKGIIKGVKAGKATVTVQDTAANRKATCTITVTANTYVKPTSEKLTLSTNSITIFKGNTYQLTAKPSSGVTFSSSNTGVATVSSSGLIKGVSAGSATVTAKYGNQSATCSVSVLNGGTSGAVHISNTSASMPAGKTLLLRSNSSGVSWSSSDTSIATVSGGFVLAKKAGSVTIYASNSSGSSSCLVNVSEAAPIRFAYCSPNCASKGQKVSFIAITDKNRSAVCFKIYYSDGSTKLVDATSKVADGSTYVWTGYGTFSAAGTYKVVAYSKIGSGSWQTCADGSTSAFVANSTNKTTTVCTERRASDEIIDLIATFEGFLPDIYDDPWTGDPTIGYGRVIFTGQQFYNHLTKREAFAYLVQSVNNDGYATKMNEFFISNNVKFNQQQFDAMVSLVYNAGTGIIAGDISNALLNCPDGTGSTGTTTYYVNGSDVRLRKGAGTNYDIIREMSYGTALTIVQKTNSSWWKVKLSDGTVGYCNTDYISSRNSSGNLDLKYVNKQNLINAVCQIHHAGGECLYGLLYRRVDEIEMFFYGDYEPCYGDYKYNIKFTCKNNPSFHT